MRKTRSPRRRARPDCFRLGGITIRFVADRATRFALLQAGELDLYQDPDAAEVLAAHPSLRETHAVHTYRHLGTGHFAVLWNHRRKPLDRAPVRTALTMLFDRETIRREVFGDARCLVQSWDVAEWARAAAAIVGSSDTSAELVADVRRVARGLTWDATADRTWAAIEATLVQGDRIVAGPFEFVVHVARPADSVAMRDEPIPSSFANRWVSRQPMSNAIAMRAATNTMEQGFQTI